MEVKNQEYAFPAEVLEVLKSRDEEELSHEQRIALENLSRHTEIRDQETLEEVSEELAEVDPLEQKHIHKLLELVPQHESTVRAVFSKERARVEDEHVEQILDICQSIETGS